MSLLTPKSKSDKRTRRHARIRGKVSGTADCPRLSVFRSNKYVYAQLIDDDKAVTIAAATSKGAKGKGMTADAQLVGKNIAAAGKAKGITKVVFDRGGFKYMGVIKTLADAARTGGLIF